MQINAVFARLKQQWPPSSAVLALLSLVALTLGLFVEQFLFLANEYWVVTERISKGPIIWTMVLFLICRDLNRHCMRRGVGWRDLLVTVVVSLLALAFTAVEPMLTPTLLVVYFWYLLAARIEPGKVLILWLLLIFSLPYYTRYAWMPLQELTVVVTETLLAIVGIPTMVQQFYIAIPAGMFEIEEGCSGVRFLANNLILTFLFGLMNGFGLTKFALSFTVAIPVALIANWIRVTSIVVVAHRLGMEHPWVVNHAELGWVVYAGSLVPFFYLLLKVQRMRNGDEAVVEFKAGKVLFGMPAVSLAGFVVVLLLAYRLSAGY